MPRLPLSHPRARVIHFRVTEQEYDIVQAACLKEGGHNLSEFARAATLRLARSGDLHNQITTLGQTLSRVDTTLSDLVTTLKR